MTRPDIRYFEHESDLLRDNPMGDPHVRYLPVYVPPGYDEGRDKPYPVIFVLHGWSGRGVNYLCDSGCFGQPLLERFDDTIKNGAKPFLAVFPDCSSKMGCSQYVDSIANGPYMDYLCRELVPFVDSRFHTHADREYRGVVGHSSGGFGALVLGMLQPDTFGFICSSAGDAWYEYLYTFTLPTTVNELRKAGGVEPFIEAYLANPSPRDLLGPEQEITMLNLSMCPCYAPNLDVPLLKGDLYFDPNTGELCPEVWPRFLEWDPVLMIDRYVHSLLTLRWIHLEAGLDDEFGLHLGHRQIAQKLTRYEINHVLNEYPGKHGGHHYRMAQRIERMVDHM